jgi:hypothetical protein
MSKRSIRDTILVGGTITAIALGVGGSAYVQRQRDTRIDAIMTGEIQGEQRDAYLPRSDVSAVQLHKCEQSANVF